MLIPIKTATLDMLSSEEFRAYAGIYTGIEDEFFAQIQSFGLPFETKPATLESAASMAQVPEAKSKVAKEGTGEAAAANADAGAYSTGVGASCFASETLGRLRELGVRVENDCKSFWLNWISPACLTCRLGVGTETFLSSTQCPKNCFFCFNPNQKNYEYYLSHVHDMAGELEERHAQGYAYADLAVTGGEPLKHEAETLAFFAKAQELYPDAYTRLYTSGAYMTEETLEKLKTAGLNEIRFSVKTDEPASAQGRVLKLMELAKKYIGHVMVEMPVMPDNLEQMKSLLIRLDAIGVDGINLLELCFPLNNAEEFAKRGFRLKRMPYRVLYNYWYAGGLPIAGSEENCLALLEFAARRSLEMGVHYCSLENKNSSQVYQQNKPVASRYPVCVFSETDYFLKSAKVFGADVALAKPLLEALPLVKFNVSEQYGYLEFSPRYIGLLRSSYPTMQVGICYHIEEPREDGAVLRELRVDVTTPEAFDLSDL